MTEEEKESVLNGRYSAFAWGRLEENFFAVACIQNEEEILPLLTVNLDDAMEMKMLAKRINDATGKTLQLIEFRSCKILESVKSLTH